jgi:hypothetical protein
MVSEARLQSGSAISALGRQSLALGELARQFALAADGFTLLPSPTFRGLFIGPAGLHFTEDAFTLQLALEDTKSLIDIVVAYKNLQWNTFFLRLELRRRRGNPRVPVENARAIPMEPGQSTASGDVFIHFAVQRGYRQPENISKTAGTRPPLWPSPAHGRPGRCHHGFKATPPTIIH